MYGETETLGGDLKDHNVGQATPASSTARLSCALAATPNTRPEQDDVLLNYP